MRKEGCTLCIGPKAGFSFYTYSEHGAHFAGFFSHSLGPKKALSFKFVEFPPLSFCKSGKKACVNNTKYWINFQLR